jgi:N-acetyltransferase
MTTTPATPATPVTPAAPATFELPTALGPPLEPWVLEGTVVRLEPLVRAHEEALAEAARPQEIWEHSIGPRRREEVLQYIERAIADRDAGTGCPFAVRHLAEGRVIGSTRFHSYRREHRSVEIGYTWYHPSYWRTAVNTECKLLLLAVAFERLGCIRVQFRVSVNNRRSRAAVARLGAVEEGTLRSEWLLPDGRRRDMTYYSILDHEWPGVKARLAARLKS